MGRVGNRRANLAGNAARNTVLNAQVAALIDIFFKDVFHVTQSMILSEDRPTLLASLQARDNPVNYL